MFLEPLQHILDVIYIPPQGPPSIIQRDIHTVSTERCRTLSAKIQCKNTITTPVYSDGKIY